MDIHLKRLVTGAVVAASLLSTLTAPTASAGPAPAIQWGSCTDAALVAGGAECGTLEVPLDYAAPRGKKITLALSRVRHRTTASQGVLLTVPDPLSGAGLNLSLLGSRVPNNAGDSYDWIGFARRGLAPSVPALSCDAGYWGFNRPEYVPTTPELEQRWLDRTKAYADACARSQPDLLAHMKTTDTAADMESIRAALGAPQVTLFGQAYGTYVGQVYSTLFPDRVRRMVLDSNVDPRRVWYNAAAFDQDVPLQKNLDIWFDWLASHDDAYHLGADRAAIKRVWDEQLKAVATNPADGVIGPNEWADVFVTASYFRQIWPFLGAAFSNWVTKGDGASLRGLFDQILQRGSDNTYAALMGQACTDAPWPTNWSKWRADSDAAHAKAPDTTWGNTWFNTPCFFWHAPAGKPVPVNGSRVRSALLIDETLDAATPFEGSLEVRSRFPNSALISEPGGTSNAAVLSGNACVDTKIAAYLATGELPARKPGRRADVECAPTALPEPLPAAQ
jgi:pimeloyl-ACP methyl ester carboxylesterase